MVDPQNLRDCVAEDGALCHYTRLEDYICDFLGENKVEMANEVW